MFGIETHPAFGSLKKILVGIQPKNYKEFISILQTRARQKAEAWKTDTDNYGFSKFEAKFNVSGKFDKAGEETIEMNPETQKKLIELGFTEDKPAHFTLSRCGYTFNAYVKLEKFYDIWMTVLHNND